VLLEIAIGEKLSFSWLEQTGDWMSNSDPSLNNSLSG
jgi:hypothetical protein